MISLGGESLSRNKDFATLTRNAAPKSRLKRGVVAIQLEKQHQKTSSLFCRNSAWKNPLGGK